MLKGAMEVEKGNSFENFLNTFNTKVEAWERRTVLGMIEIFDQRRYSMFQFVFDLNISLNITENGSDSEHNFN